MNLSSDSDDSDDDQWYTWDELNQKDPPLYLDLIGEEFEFGTDNGGGNCKHFRFFDRISDLDEKCLYSAKNVYTSKDLKKISPSLKNVYIL